MLNPQDLVGQSGREVWEKITAPMPAYFPNNVSNGGQSYSLTGFGGQNIMNFPTNVRFIVQVIDDDGILDSNGYYKVIKFDQWFGTDNDQVQMPMRLKYTFPGGSTPEPLVVNDLVFVESYSITDGSPTASDDQLLLCKPLLIVHPTGSTGS